MPLHVPDGAIMLLYGTLDNFSLGGRRRWREEAAGRSWVKGRGRREGFRAPYIRGGALYAFGVPGGVRGDV